MKSRAKLALFFIILIAIIQLASAQTIENFEITVQIVNSEALINYEIDSYEDSLGLELPKDARITASSAEYDLSEGKFYASNFEGTHLSLEYVTASFIEREKYFTADFKASARNLTVKILLPEQAILENAYPSPEIDSDGRHIILKWQSPVEESFPVFVIYTGEKDSLLPLIITAAVIAAIMAAVLVFLTKKEKRIKKPKRGKIREIEKHLLEPEEKVVKVLKENRKEMWQKQIQLETGFSKAKLSRTLRNLEARGLVKRIPLGNTNKIRLLNRY